ncbi:MAG: hypothetical protein H6581_19780 [Bacteroidia bacterium]|nr:hypothetical protein [Bacteroidia bacterium]
MIAKSKKQQLHQILDQIEMEGHLEQIEALLKGLKAAEDQGVYQLNAAELEAIQKGDQQILEGKTIPYEEAKKKHLEKWGLK